MNAGFHPKITSESVSSSGADLARLFLLPCLFFLFLSVFSFCFSALPAHWNLLLEIILACTAVWLSINKINRLAESVRKTVYVILFSLSAADSFQFFVPAAKSLFWLILPFHIGFAICRLFSAPAAKTTVLASAAAGTLLAFSVYSGWQLQTYARFELLYIGRHVHSSAVRELFWLCGLSFLLSAGFFAFFSYFLDKDFSDTYATAVQVIIVKEGSEIKTADDLEGKKIGVQENTTGDIYVTGDFGEESVKRYSKGNDAVAALSAGIIDAVVIDNEPAKNYVAANDGLKVLDTSYADEEYAIAIRKDNTDLKDKINAALAELKADGTLDSIVAKYIPEN